MSHADRDLTQIRRRFIEGLQQGLAPAALRKYVIAGQRSADDRSGSGRKRFRG